MAEGRVTEALVEACRGGEPTYSAWTRLEALLQRRYLLPTAAGQEQDCYKFILSALNTAAVPYWEADVAGKLCDLLLRAFARYNRPLDDSVADAVLTTAVAAFATHAESGALVETAGPDGAARIVVAPGTSAAAAATGTVEQRLHWHAAFVRFLETVLKRFAVGGSDASSARLQLYLATTVNACLSFLTVMASTGAVNTAVALTPLYEGEEAERDYRRKTAAAAYGSGVSPSARPFSWTAVQMRLIQWLSCVHGGDGSATIPRAVEQLTLMMRYCQQEGLVSRNGSGDGDGDAPFPPALLDGHQPAAVEYHEGFFAGVWAGAVSVLAGSQHQYAPLLLVYFALIRSCAAPVDRVLGPSAFITPTHQSAVATAEAIVAAAERCATTRTSAETAVAVAFAKSWLLVLREAVKTESYAHSAPEKRAAFLKVCSALCDLYYQRGDSTGPTDAAAAMLHTPYLNWVAMAQAF